MDLTPVTGETAVLIRHAVPTRLKRRGVEMRLVIDGLGNVSRTANPEPALIKAVARAYRWFDELASGRAESLREIAKAEGVGDRYVSRLLPLAFLAPDIVETILAGAQPVDLTAERLTKHTELPLRWVEQTALLEFN